MKISVTPYVANKIQRSAKDFIFQTFRAGGKGGQNVNKVNTAVRYTDKITGLSAEARDSRSQKQNRTSAFLRLVNQMIEFYQDEEALRSTIDVSETVIRTYSFTRNEVVDHRNKEHFDLEDTLDGNLEPIHMSLRSTG